MDAGKATVTAVSLPVRSRLAQAWLSKAPGAFADAVSGNRPPKRHSEYDSHGPSTTPAVATAAAARRRAAEAEAPGSGSAASTRASASSRNASGRTAASKENHSTEPTRPRPSSTSRRWRWKPPKSSRTPSDASMPVPDQRTNQASRASSRAAAAATSLEPDSLPAKRCMAGKASRAHATDSSRAAGSSLPLIPARASRPYQRAEVNPYVGCPGLKEGPAPDSRFSVKRR